MVFAQRSFRIPCSLPSAPLKRWQLYGLFHKSQPACGPGRHERARVLPLLPPIVDKCSVGLCHPMRIFPFFYRPTSVL